MSSDVIQPTSLDRLLDSIRKIIRAEFPQLTYLGLWEYAVEGTDGVTIDCSPVDTAIPLPSLSKVPMLSGLLGEIATPVTGKRCVIVFLNGDPTKARCVSIDGANEHAMTTEAATLLVYNVLSSLAAGLLALGAQPIPTAAILAAALQPLIVPALTGALSAQSAPAPPGTIAQQALNATLISTMTAGTAPSNALGPLAAGLVLPSKTPNVSGLFPGLGATK